ncbi:MAG: carbon storage regulator CsrA [Phycisphaeraceae bacterium]|nr:carbon storage regulator CsrA [Phycisphaeraceae bacterium]
MLVLSRQRDETIMIGDLVEITIVDIRGDKVRLGINAPPQVAVHRKEVYEAIKAENQKAANANGTEFSALTAAVRPGRRAALKPAGRIAGDIPATTNGTPPAIRPQPRNKAST